MTRFNFILLIIIQGYFVHSQSIPSINFTTNEGLPANYVYGVIEDQEGYIWAYTENGISRYDGYKWENLKDEWGIRGKDIVYGFNQPAGSIFFKSFDENLIYKKEDNEFKPLKYRNSTIFLDNNTPFIYNEDSLHRVNPDGTITSSKTTIPSAIISEKETVFERVNYKIRFLQKASTWTLNMKGKSYKLPYIDNSNPPTFKQPKIIKVRETEYCLISTSNSIHLHNLTTDEYIDLEPLIGDTKDVVRYFYQARPNSFIVYSILGFVEFDEDLLILDKMNFQEVFKDVDILNTFKDEENNIWLGSMENGLYFIPESYRKIKTHTTPGKLPKSIEGLARSLDGDLYAATDNLRIYTVKEDNLQLLDFPEKRENFKGIIPLKNGNVLYTAVSKLEINKKKIQQVNENPFFYTKIDSIEVPVRFDEFLGPHYIIKDRYIINYNGILLIGRKVGNKILQEHLFPTPLIGNVHFKLYPHLDTCFVGLCNKLYFITEDTIITSTFPDDDYIESLIYVNKPKVLLGMRDGLYLYDYVNHKILHKMEGNNIKAITKGNDQNYYAIVENTLRQYTLQNDSLAFIYSWTTREGLPSSRLMDVEWKDGYIYLASETELTVIPSEFKPKKSKTLISYDKPKLNLLGGNGEATNNQFSNNQNSFLIDHRVIHPASMGQIRYEYQLSPIMTEMDTTYDPQLSFYSLPPGRYTYRVKAVDQNNTHYQFEEINFVVNKVFYAQTWFIITMLLALLGAVLYYRNRKIKLHKKEISFQNTINDLKLNAIQSQMNPHFIFNALGSIQYFIQTKDVDKADEYLSDFAVLVRKILNTSVKKFITLEEEIGLLKLYTKLENIRFDHKLEIDIVEPEGLNYDFLLPPMIIQPFVENSINHGLFNLEDRKGHLTVHFRMIEEALQCIITDNGIGREASKKYKLSKGHKPRGLKITQEKIEAIRQSDNHSIDVRIEDLYKNNKACGTRVTILFNRMKK